MSRALLILNTDNDRRVAQSWCEQAKAGTRVEFKAVKRSLEQNSLMWAALTDVSRQVTHMGQHYTPDQWKVLFMHACGREVQFLPGLDHKTFLPWGQSSSDLSKEEMTNLIEFIFSWGAENGVTFHDPGSEAPSTEPEGSASAHDVPTSTNGASTPAVEPVEAGAEAQEEPDAAPASDLRAECITAFMRTATDKALTVADRRDILADSKDWWKEKLPADLDFVRSCLTTADKVAKGELGEGPARKYLEGLG